MNDEIERDYNVLLSITKNICGDRIIDVYDVCHSMIIELYNLPKNKQKHIIDNGYLKFYFCKMVHYSVNSKSSPYYRKNLLVRDQINISDISDMIDDNNRIDFDLLDNDIDKLLTKKVDWYTKDIFYKYTKEKTSFRKMSKKYKIPQCSLWYSYNEARKIITDNLNYDDYRVD